ncbi:MAG: ATP-binding protein [Microthrixaceae bacterium]
MTPELTATLRRLKLGQLVDTLPERLALAKTSKMSHAEFLQLLLSDEIARRDTTSAARKAKAAKTRLDGRMRLGHWDATANVTYDQAVLDESRQPPVRRRRTEHVIIGPVGVGKTFLAVALGHTAIRRGRSVHFERSDQLFKRLRIARLDNTLDAELRKLLRVDLLIIDDYALTASDSAATSDFYDLIVERHRRASTVITSNRDPSEWLALLADQLLAQSAIDRFSSAAFELVIDGGVLPGPPKPQLAPPAH